MAAKPLGKLKTTFWKTFALLLPALQPRPITLRPDPTSSGTLNARPHLRDPEIQLSSTDVFSGKLNFPFSINELRGPRPEAFERAIEVLERLEPRELVEVHRRLSQKECWYAGAAVD